MSLRPSQCAGVTQAWLDHFAGHCSFTGFFIGHLYRDRLSGLWCFGFDHCFGFLRFINIGAGGLKAPHIYIYIWGVFGASLAHGNARFHAGFIMWVAQVARHYHLPAG